MAVANKEFSTTFYGGLAIVCGFVIIILTLTGSYFLTQTQIHAAQNAQTQNAQMAEMKLCKTLNTLKAIQPPPGDPNTNPSRAFDLKQHDALAQLASDLACPSIPSAGK